MDACIEPNPDIPGIGVQAAIYTQAILSLDANRKVELDNWMEVCTQIAFVSLLTITSIVTVATFIIKVLLCLSAPFPA